jgi:hypothetical protein
MSNGFFSIQGAQINTAQAGRVPLGPFNIPFGTVAYVETLSLTAGTTAVAVPAGASGVAIIPPIGAPPGGVTLKQKTVSGDSGEFISTEYPTVIEFDTVTPNVPANLYLVAAGGSITVVVQFV